MYKAAAVTIFLTGAVFLSRVSCFSVQKETDLRNDLFANYSKAVRPDTTTPISLLLSITSIDAVDIRNQQFSITAWWSMRWIDSRLTWDAPSYDFINVIQVHNDVIWTPALVVSNSIDDLTAIAESSIPLRVSSTGVVVWNPPAISTVSCEMDITYFPFDTHSCSIQVTSFGYSIQEVNIMVYGDGIIKRYFEPNGQWNLLDEWSDRDTFAEDGYTYARVYYYFKVERRPLYYGLNFILPVIINALLTIFVFVLPADSGEKIGYCLTVLLAFMVILTLIAVDLPQTAKYTSILELYIAIVLIMGGLAVILSIFVLYVHHLPEDKKIPKWVKRFTRTAMVINCHKSDRVSPERSPSEDHFELEVYSNGMNDPLDYNSSIPSTGSYPYKPQFNGGQPINSPSKHTTSSINQSNTSFQTPVMKMKKVDDKKEKKKAQKDKKHEKITWQIVSNMIDGLLLRIYGVFLVVSTIVIMVILTS